MHTCTAWFFCYICDGILDTNRRFRSRFYEKNQKISPWSRPVGKVLRLQEWWARKAEGKEKEGIKAQRDNLLNDLGRSPYIAEPIVTVARNRSSVVASGLVSKIHMRSPHWCVKYTCPRNNWSFYVLYILQRNLPFLHLIFVSTFNDCVFFSVDIEKYALSFKKRPKTGWK